MKTLLLVFMGFLCLASAEQGIPTREQFLAVDQARECTHFRSLLKEADANVEEAQRSLSATTRDVAKAKSLLDDCADQKGLTRPDDATLAELCSDAYESWLSPSYRVLMVREDFRAAKSAAREISSHLRFYCPNLPKL